MEKDPTTLIGWRLPVIAIAGRTNVGKSALFNRLAGRRMAIVHEEEGVTRDRVAAPAMWEERRFELIDTGGILTLDDRALGDTLDASVRQQTEAALGDASAIIFVMDIATGPVPLDDEVARLLRRAGKPVFAVANKADTEARDEDAAPFDRFGFPVFPVSALHNRGIHELMTAVCRVLPPVSAEKSPQPLRVVFSGRPNVGKSSLTNAVIRSDRVIVSPVAGTTRDSIDIPFRVGTGETARDYVLTDTAGIRQQGKIDTAVEKFSLMRAEESIRTCHVAVLLVDAEQGPTQQDKKIAALIREHRRGCVVVINKWDLAQGKVQEKVYAAGFRKAVPFLAYAPLLFASAKTGYGTKALLGVIDHVAAQIRATLPTGLLNRTLADAYEKTPPPTINGKRLKIFYATQVGVDPVRLVLFVNDPTRWVPAFETYLVKALRSRFGLEGAPVVLTGRRKSQREDPSGNREH